MAQLHNEIYEVEAQIARERDGMAIALEECVESARDKLVSPPSLLAIVGIGFLLGEVSKRRRAAAPAAKKAGIAALLGGAAASAFSARYGSPWMMLLRWLFSRRSEQPRDVPSAGTARPL